MQNGGAYGHGTTEGGVGFKSRAARAAGSSGQFAFSSGGAGEPGQDCVVKRSGQDKLADLRVSWGWLTPRWASGGGDSWSRMCPDYMTSCARAVRARSSDERVAQLVRKTLDTKPKDGTHWSVRQIARQTRLSKSTVHRIWQAFGLEPHRQRRFKLSNDPFFVEKVRDIVGLYLHPTGKCGGSMRG